MSKPPTSLQGLTCGHCSGPTVATGAFGRGYETHRHKTWVTLGYLQGPTLDLRSGDRANN